MSRSRQIVVASVLTMVVLSGCDSNQSSSTTTTTANRAATSDAVPTNLRATVFDRLPANFIEEPVGSKSDGPLDLLATAEAVDDQQTSEQELLLRQNGFVGGYQRTWVVAGTAELLIIRVQVMGSPAKAFDYFNLLTYGGKASGQTSFSTAPLPEASGFTRYFDGSTGPQVSQDVNLVQERLFFHLIFTGPRGRISPRDVLAIAESQSAEAADQGYR